MDRSVTEAGDLLVEALRTGSLLNDLPMELQPGTWDEVYRIQDAILARLGPIGAWKVSPVDRGSGRICVPIPVSLVQQSPAVLKTAASAPELEVEIGVRLAADLPDLHRAYSAEAVADAIGSLHVAIEIVGSRFIDRTAVQHMTAIADLGNNGGIVIGPPLEGWREFEVGSAALQLNARGEQVGSSEGGWSTAEMLDALAALANHAARRSGGLKAGQFVITGARIGPLPVPAPASVVATASYLGPVHLAISR